MKIEPMSVGEIRRLVTKINWQFADHIGTESHERAGLILAWIHAEAMLRKTSHAWGAECDPYHGQYGKSKENQCVRCNQKDRDWLAAVKAEVGWPEGE